MTDDLKSFKISAKVPRTVDRKKSGDSGAEPAPSAGFPVIEALLEQDEIDLGGFGERRAQLADLATNGADNREKANAKKAAIAYERTHDLLEHLLSTKEQMNGGGKDGAA